jgi:hypothetical protein
MAKSAAGCTTMVMVVECASEPLVAVIVSG